MVARRVHGLVMRQMEGSPASAKDGKSTHQKIGFSWVSANIFGSARTFEDGAKFSTSRKNHVGPWWWIGFNQQTGKSAIWSL
jgi:hypothetical protein